MTTKLNDVVSRWPLDREQGSFFHLLMNSVDYARADRCAEMLMGAESDLVEIIELMGHPESASAENTNFSQIITQTSSHVIEDKQSHLYLGSKYKLEYVWLDGYEIAPNLRSKTLIKEFDAFPKLEQLPLWGFDGSSTRQAEGHSSDCLLKPVAVYPDATRINGALVMCEVLMPDGTPHSSNTRATIVDDLGAWFGFEQHFFFFKDGHPLGFPIEGYPAPEGPYYSGVGFKNVGAMAREIVEKHLDLCLYAGINHEFMNAEKVKGQWAFAVFDRGAKSAADQMWIARYLMIRLCESSGIDIELHCKPLREADWHGSSMHTNFSTTYMREVGGKDYFENLMAAFAAAREDHIAVYGPDNHMRLTGKHETAPIYQFSYGVADRSASIRVPHRFINNGYKGYLEDRRPNSQSDPYQVVGQILRTISSVERTISSVQIRPFRAAVA